MNKTLSSDRSLLGGCLGLILSIPIEFTWTFSFSARALAIECSAHAFHLGSGIRILDACRRFGGSSDPPFNKCFVSKHGLSNVRLPERSLKK
jgi:hypothetical protein